MPISSLEFILAIIGILIVLRLALFKLFNPQVELPPLSVESAAPQAEMVSQTSIWPVVVLLVVVVVSIVGLMAWGSTLGGG